MSNQPVPLVYYNSQHTEQWVVTGREQGKKFLMIVTDMGARQCHKYPLWFDTEEQKNGSLSYYAERDCATEIIPL